jgi:DNA-directed RNA polymerase specialized sigma24 family protein
METRQGWLEALDTLGALRPRQRRMVGLFASGHSYDEISAATGASWRTVDRQLGRARKRLSAA